MSTHVNFQNTGVSTYLPLWCVLGMHTGKEWYSFSHVFPCRHEARRLSCVIHVLLVHVCLRCRDPLLQPPGESAEASIDTPPPPQGRVTTVTVEKMMKTTTNATRLLPINVSIFLAGVNDSMRYNRITAAELHLRILVNFRRPFICCEEGESHDNNCTV